MSKMVCMAPYQKAKEILRPQPIDVTFCDTQMFFNLAGQLGIFHKAEVHIGMNYYQKNFLKQNSTFGATNVRRPKFLDVCPVQLGGPDCLVTGKEWANQNTHGNLGNSFWQFQTTPIRPIQTVFVFQTELKKKLARC
jgi:hypothetical protein